MARRKKKTEAAADGEVVGIGHNKCELTEDERRVLLYRHKALIAVHEKDVTDAQAGLSKARAARKSAFELAKSEYGPDAKADIEELFLLEKPRSGEALQADIERKMRLARWANVAQGFQGALFDFTDRRPAVDAAREQGKTAGLAGDICKPPFDPSLPQHQAWLEGWHEGQAVVVSMLKPPADGAQMDLAQRSDLGDRDGLVMTEQPFPDVSKPPFAAPDAAMPETPPQPN